MDFQKFEEIYKLIYSNPYTYLPPVGFIVGILLVIAAFSSEFKFSAFGLNINPIGYEFSRWLYGVIGAFFIIISLNYLTGNSTPPPPDFLNSSNPKDLFERGKVLEGLKDYRNASKVYSKALNLQPDNGAEIWYHLGAVQEELKENEQAAYSCKRALIQQPKYADAAFCLGYNLHAVDKYEEALAAYGKATDLDPTNSSAFYNKGKILELLERQEEAVEAYKAAHKLDPEDSDIYNALKILNAAISSPKPTTTQLPTEFLEEEDDTSTQQGVTPAQNLTSNSRKGCGDELPKNLKSYPIKLYPVFIDYSNKDNPKDLLDNLRLNFSCNDAFLRNDKVAKKSIQVASFTNLDRANNFKNLLTKIGNARVGEPTLITSPRPSKR